MTNFQQTNAPRDLGQPISAAGSLRSKALPAFQQASTFRRDIGQPRFSPQTTRAIWLLLSLLEAVLALRFVFKLAGASGAGTLAGLLYGFTGIFLLPFGSLAVGPASGLVLEISTLIAVAAYGLLARAAWMIFYRPYANIGATPTSIVEQGRP